MMPNNLQIISGDIFDHMDEWDIMVNQTNCLGVFGAGIDKQIANKYPKVKESYINICKGVEDPHNLLGSMLFCAIDNNKYIANLFGQYNYGKNPLEQYTDYDAFNNALNILPGYTDALKANRIAFPYGIGCGLANENWEIIESYICKLANMYKELEIKIYKLEE